jgi:predicted nucleic acid-binding protein
MNADARYVLDANVVVSALLFYESVPGQAFARAQAEGAILISRDLVVELNDVLSREKFDRYVTREEREGGRAARSARQRRVLAGRGHQPAGLGPV